MQLKKEKVNPTMLVILDGFGISKQKKGNAVYAAKMPTWQKILNEYPHTQLKASGNAVGLLSGYIGNSEVGHTTLGAGKIVKTVLKKFHESIDDKSFFKNETLLQNLKKIKKQNALHLMGLLSNGGVHSHEKHLNALIHLAAKLKIKNVYIHPFLDGRDVAEKSASTFLKKLDKICNIEKCGKIATLHGRFYAMDRDNNWDRTKISYDVLCDPKLNHSIKPFNDLRANGISKIPEFHSWQEVLKWSYVHNITDEFFYPTRLLEDGIIKKDDGIIFFNFRPDRARQLTECFLDPKFNHFKIQDLNPADGTLKFFVSTTQYKKDFKNLILFEKEIINNTLLDEIEKNKNNNSVFIIAETEKYAHVTYFFKGRKEEEYSNETRILVPSIKTKNYIQHPEMSAEKITEHIIKSLKTNPAFFYLINYANPDMVGHSGNFDSTVKACEFVDKQIKKLYELAVEKMNGTIFILSDHGNAEEMLTKTNKPKTSHTKNPVPFVFVNKKWKNKKLKMNNNLGLANVAPTILKFLNLKIPKQMEQKTIF
ncbi:MAG: 2,3-bisphosphoglycerate-independent phosphoglycerate mutase [bacterium]